MKSLKEKHMANVTVVDSKKDALKAVLDAIPKGASISSAGSMTLHEIGFTEWAKTQKDHKDFKAQALDAEKNNDWPAALEARRLGQSADVFISSVCAITHLGELYVVDASGSRVGGFLSSKHLLVVAGTNKIVKDHLAAFKRTQEFCYPMESARVRDAYKAMGAQQSNVTNTLSLACKSPFSQEGRLTVILIKEAAGY